IYFIFSRAGCDQALEQCRAGNLRLTSHAERAEIVEFLELKVAPVDPADLDALGYDALAESLGRGVASHHAGMLPLFKEAVEELFAQGLVKVVFATETLSLGINMPARTVAIERLTKWQGERHELLTPGEYTQLTGRAGRRRLDSRAGAGVLRPAVTPLRAHPRARLDPHLPADELVPALLQHGRQPGRQLLAGAGRAAAGLLVRPVPGRPDRARGRADPGAQPRVPARLPGVGGLRPRRRPGILGAAAPGPGPRERPGRCRAPGRDPGGGRGPALAHPRHRDLGPRRPPPRPGRGDRPGRRPRQLDRGAGPDRGPPGPPGGRARPRRRPGTGPQGGPAPPTHAQHRPRPSPCCR